MQINRQTFKQLPHSLGIFFLLLCFPLTASADAGTPLMWASAAHLVIGNFFIGIFEGLILASIFKLRKTICIIAMIPANYFSAWVGDCFLNDMITRSLPFDLYNAWHWLWVMVAFTFLMTLILEWPFVFLCFRKEQNRLKRSLVGNLLVNALSYVLLFGWYWIASGTTLYTKMNIVQPAAITFPKQGLVYFISETNGTVCRFNLSSQQIEKICTLKELDKDDRLYVKTSSYDVNHWDILDSLKKTVICSNLQTTAVQGEREMNTPDRVEGTWFNFGTAPKLASAADSDWNFETGFWPIEGIHGKNEKTGEKIYFSLETPFVAWNIRNATHLPDDYIVFQLGDDQICLLKAATNEIALLARGHGPVVVIPREIR